MRKRLLTSTLLISGTMFALPAVAQDAVADDQESIVVTGSRIARPNLESNSPIAVVTGDQATENADITLDTFLNTLPQVNPAGTSTSNNPGNGGQSNVNLRGLGSNRNLVLLDGRRPMVSAADQTVDLNTIPQGLIERIEVVTGGAGATYGADAIAGVVNIRLKENFEGVDLRATYANSIPETDAREYQISGVIGGNFADNKGNIAVAFEYAEREGLIKAQRPFAAQATSTTGTPPTGRFVEVAGNAVSQAAINAIFAGYGVAAAQAPVANSSQIHFNQDGSLFGAGIFNSPLNVSNYRYAADGSDAAGANQNFFPDFYSYNFDAINLLVLPFERKSAFAKGNYELNESFDVFFQGSYTETKSATALAPTPIGTRIYRTGTSPSTSFATSNLVQTGFITNSIVPVTNPFIPADLRALLATRTGDDPALVGSGATEPIRMSIRSLNTGLRESENTNTVIQLMGGLRGEIAPGWRYEAYYSWGRTTIDVAASGNVNVQNLQALLEAPDGGNSICAGGYNPFGIQPLSAACVEYLNETGFTRTEFTQRIAQGYVQGDLATLPAGTLAAVLGVESRQFRYEFDPGALSGPIAGFNTATPDLGTNSFLDIFGELYVPIAKGSSWADTLDLTLGYRASRSDFNDIQNGIDGDPVWSSAYKAELSWAPIPEVRFRGTYQRSVRAPNFGELFSGGASFVQAFDPCSIGTNFRTSGGAAATALCQATGVGAPASFVATPGLQVNLGIAGNPNLKPEKADTFTGGIAFDVAGFTGSIDYYNINISDPVFGPDTNLFIAACYGYQGGLNSGLSATNPYCSSVVRSGSNFSFIAVDSALGGDANSNFTAINQGKIKTSGIDFQLGYKLPTAFVGESSALNFGLWVNYLIDYKVNELPGVTLDYAGSASVFGAGLGTSFPRWRGTGNVAWNFDPITLSTRVRYIDKMVNRASIQFPGEEFTGPGSVWYFDFAVEAKVEALTLRLGVNNAFDRQPPQYTPNVQSGTDPSLYDVIGRRAYVQARLKF
ncbi:TonB-dependent receptor domain-containing protein [Sphingomonas turrisvirgatae]|uniref:TonB-dependent receptor domain-containing protein n=1 Tax=Sphingomonas turrisvirgatae TaxID=1888892 RepID=UPI00156B7029|nr:TonB-dependent receptor [Sphingomonas turrisvirgatae]